MGRLLGHGVRFGTANETQKPMFPLFDLAPDLAGAFVPLAALSRAANRTRCLRNRHHTLVIPNFQVNVQQSRTR
jgi:hypothetical protein